MENKPLITLSMTLFFQINFKIYNQKRVDEDCEGKMKTRKEITFHFSDKVGG